jgi:hypothetical protein
VAVIWVTLWEAAANLWVFRLWSSGLWHLVVLYMDTKISEERDVSIFTGFTASTLVTVKTWKINPLRKIMICLHLITTCAEVDGRWGRIYRDTFHQVCMNITSCKTESHHVKKTCGTMEFLSKTSILAGECCHQNLRAVWTSFSLFKNLYDFFSIYE